MKRTKRALALLCLALALTLLMGTAYAASPLLRRGSRGADVKQLQGNLIYLGYLNDVADGIFGAKTEAAVRRYQSRNGLAADGIVGAKRGRNSQRKCCCSIKFWIRQGRIWGLPTNRAEPLRKRGLTVRGLRNMYSPERGSAFRA